jgi:hypothetical protein
MEFSVHTRDGDDQPPRFAPHDLAKLIRHRFDVPIEEKAIPAGYNGERGLHKGVEIQNRCSGPTEELRPAHRGKRTIFALRTHRGKWLRVAV